MLICSGNSKNMFSSRHDVMPLSWQISQDVLVFGRPEHVLTEFGYAIPNFTALHFTFELNNKSHLILKLGLVSWQQVENKVDSEIVADDRDKVYALYDHLRRHYSNITITAQAGGIVNVYFSHPQKQIIFSRLPPPRLGLFKRWFPTRRDPLRTYSVSSMASDRSFMSRTR
jgi:hypothetical protein